MLAEQALSLPTGWAATRLGSLAEESKVRAGSEHQLPVLSVTKHRGIVPSRDFFKKAVYSRDTSNYKVVQPGQVAYATIHLNEGSIGRLGTRTPGVVSPMYTVFDVKAEVDSDYLLAVLKSRQSLIVYDRITQGTVARRGGIPFKTLSNLVLHHPPLSEQRKIATILSSMDEAIEKTHLVIEQQRVVKRALMQELLTRGVPKRSRRYKKTEVGEIPWEWDVCDLSELCDRMFVGIAQAATHAYAEKGVPLVRTTNVQENHLDVGRLCYITDSFARAMKRKTLCPGDVLTARTGRPGISVVLPDTLDGAQCFTLLVSRPGPRLRSRYLCHTMNSDQGRRIVSRGQAGGAQQNLNVSVFKRARVAVPSIEEQDAICEVLDACYLAEWREKRVQRALQAVKSALTSVLLTGELRVTPDPEPE